MPTLRRMAACVTAVAAVTVFAAGCGSNDDDEGTATASGDGAAGLERAQTEVAEARKRPEPIDPQPLEGEAPKDKTVVFVNCPVAECQFESIPAGAKKLGWKLETVTAGLTPEAQADGWRRAIELKPDVLIGFATVGWSSYQEQAQRAEEAGIPVITIASEHEPGTDGHDAAIAASAVVAREDGSYADLANWVIADSEGKAKAAVLTNKSTVSFGLIRDTVKSTFTANCPECTLDDLQFNLLDIGEKLNSSIVSYLQRNPEIKYVVSPLGSATVGLADALKGAGLEDVKITSGTGIPSNFVNVAAGKEGATIGQEVEETGWRALDAAVRLLAEEDISECCREPAPLSQLIDKTTTVEDPKKSWLSTDDVAERFTRAWKLEGAS